MQGNYTTPTGEIVTVDSFDDKNKIASIHLGSGQYKWVHQGEHSKWVSNDTSKIVVEEIVEKTKKKTKN